MANATVSNLGQAAGAGSTTALFLKIFPGEVLTAFEDAQTIYTQWEESRSCSQKNN